MIKILLCGSQGRMGRMIAELAAEREDVQIAAGVDQAAATGQEGFAVFPTLEAVTAPADVLIDFSHHSLTPAVLDFVQQQRRPAVICTTGLDDALVQRVAEVAQSTPILRSGNMSVGINLLLDLVSKAAQALHETFDIEIIEKHHNRKVDAPSGTAKMLAEAVNQALANSKTFTYGRRSSDAKRQPEEIGIHAVRGGTIVGEHSVLFAGTDEVIEIRHSAASRRVFGAGALQAARFLVGRPPGLYTMKDVLSE
jgi:4-hydroxy-tetrahydrodipicolinate reductase